MSTYLFCKPSQISNPYFLKDKSLFTWINYTRRHGTITETNWIIIYNARPQLILWPKATKMLFPEPFNCTHLSQVTSYNQTSGETESSETHESTRRRGRVARSSWAPKTRVFTKQLKLPLWECFRVRIMYLGLSEGMF